MCLYSPTILEVNTTSRKRVQDSEKRNTCNFETIIPGSVNLNKIEGTYEENSYFLKKTTENLIRNKPSDEKD